MKIIFLFIFFLLGLQNLNAEAATARKKIKKRKVIVIDAGRESGITKGMKICFFNKRDKKVGCGNVRRVLRKRAFVRMKKKTFRKVRKGFYAEINDPSENKSESNKFNIRGLVGGSATLPATMSFLKYQPANGNDEKWVPGESIGTSWIAGLETEYSGIVLGFRYQLMGPNGNYQVDYSESNINDYGQIKQFQNNMGFWADYMMSFKLKKFDISLGGGLDVNMSTIMFEFDRIVDKKPNGTLIQATSDLTSFGLRIPIRGDINLGSFVFSVGGSVIIGIAGEAVYKIVTNQDTNKSNDANYQANFTQALGHKPAIGSFGWLSVGFPF